MSFGLPDPTFKDFQQGWDRYVQRQRSTDVYWNPISDEWETYNRAQYIMTRTSLPRVVLVEGDVGGWVNKYVYPEVKKVGLITKQVARNAVWNPRDGRWYFSQARSSKPEPKKESEKERLPKWVKDLNAELDAVGSIDATPEEKASARATIFERYLSHLPRDV